MTVEKSCKNTLRALRRDTEEMLAIRLKLEEQRRLMDALAYQTGNVALSQLTEAQADTLAAMKRVYAKIWNIVHSEIEEN